MIFLNLLNEDMKKSVNIFLEKHGLSFDIQSDISRPVDLKYGDLSSSMAMKLKKVFSGSPMDIGESLKESLLNCDAVKKYVKKVDVIKPGFINFTLKSEVKYEILKEIHEMKDSFGCTDNNGENVIVEFVSANPTGPLHIGHARQAVLGDAICNLLKTQGQKPYKEFYYNDAGNQIETLAKSVQMRLKGYKPGDECWPLDAGFYNGEYIEDVAQSFLKKEKIEFKSANERIDITASGDIEDYDGIKKYAVAYLRNEQNADLNSIGITFDGFQLESALYKNGKVEKVVNALIDSGHTKEEGGALWLKSTTFGDDKDRVMKKSEGGYTYFVPDVAYHKDKWDRGFKKAINIQGSDHHGTVARVRAGLQAMSVGIPKGYPSYVLHTMVNVIKDGLPVKLSKRAGSYVTLSDVVSWTSSDAVKFALLSKKAQTEDTFNVDVMIQKNNENPVYYVQYAHARIKTIAKKWVAEGGELSVLLSKDNIENLKFELLSTDTELKLLSMLEKYTDVLRNAAMELAPHNVITYLRELAAMYHTYYGQERVFVDDVDKKKSRLVLSLAIAQVIKNGLSVVGVSAPEFMESSEK